MSVFELLKSDHGKIASIFEKLGTTTERAVKTREDLFARLKDELEIHSYIEELLFYPAIRNDPKIRAAVLEGYEKHHLIKVLLKELTSIPVDSEHWTAKLRVLRKTVEQHVEEEEGDVFKKAGELLSKEEADDLGARMEEEKQRDLKGIVSDTQREEEDGSRGASPAFGTGRRRESQRPESGSQFLASCPGFLSDLVRRLCD